MPVTLISKEPALPVDFKAGQLVYCKDIDVLVLVVDGDFKNRSSDGIFAGIALKSIHHQLFDVDTFWDTSSFELYDGEVHITN